MEPIKQISIFIENKPGRLMEAASLLAEHGIDLRSLTLADTRDFGILRLIVNKPDEACSLLKEHGWPFNVAKVVGIKVPDRPGGMNEVLGALSQANINLEYMYAFGSRRENSADVIFCVDDPEACLALLATSGITFLTPEEAYGA